MWKNKRWQNCLALAIGAGLGWAALCGRVDWLPRAVAQTAQEAAIVFTVRLPADAVLEVEGTKTEATGQVRTFQTPSLAVGKDYVYTLKATSRGKEVTRKIRLAHGTDNSFDLRGEFPSAAASTGAPREITTIGPPKDGIVQARHLAAPKQGATSGPSKAGTVQGEPKDMEAIAKNAEAFVEAFHKGDAEALAAFWAVDGDYTDVTGQHIQGREAIAAAFKEFFAQHKGAKIRIDSLALRFVTPDLAIEDGTTEVFPTGEGPPSRTRYTNVHVKKDGQWLLHSVRGASYASSTNYEHLRGLEWIIGVWSSDAAKGEVEQITLDWSEKQSFIVGSFATTYKDAPVSGAVYWIGWDPLAKHIRSWSFDDAGGFGEGTWSKDGTKWVIKSNSVLTDGKKGSATYLLTPIDADTIAFQVKDRSVDGNALPDTNEIKLKRVK
jgi:uncharacterized protein (TIGR02246 family)